MNLMDVENSLKGWLDPYLRQDLFSAKMIKNIIIVDDRVSFEVTLGYP